MPSLLIFPITGRQIIKKKIKRRPEKLELYVNKTRSRRVSDPNIIYSNATSNLKRHRMDNIHIYVYVLALV